MTVTWEQFLERVRQSGLIRHQDLSKFAEKLSQSLPPHHQSGEQLAEKLLNAGWLTPWQKEKLWEGKPGLYRLGKYHLLDHLGKGGMSQVYLAEHQMMQRQVAIKVLPYHRVNQTSYLERFLQESKAISNLSHPNLIQAFTVGNQDDLYYLVMEYLTGLDLEQLVKTEGPLPIQKALFCIRQAAEGLKYAHSQGLIHRDIKPSNLFLTKDGKVKILDLGLALLQQQKYSVTIKHKENVIGTTDFMAPEQAVDSHAVDARADLYALGGTWYYLVTGQILFKGKNTAQTILAHQQKMPSDPRQLREDLPEVQANCILKLLAKSPEDRIQSAEEFITLLDRIHRGESVTVEPPPPPPFWKDWTFKHFVGYQPVDKNRTFQTSGIKPHERYTQQRLFFRAARRFFSKIALVVLVIILFLSLGIGLGFLWGIKTQPDTLEHEKAIQILNPSNGQ
ncbi:Serine/threonine protein kinase [Planctomycetales bacterium 10988]|nr:Serine/threonine protein kinase [Planctomycetales bacterium 10988]